MKYTLSFDEQQMQLIVNALGELPYKMSAKILNDIAKQAAAQEAEHRNSTKEKTEGVEEWPN